MRLESTSDVSEFNARLMEYLRRHPRDMSSELRKQGRLLIQHVITLTPPKTRKQGRDRVEKDIKHVMEGWDRVPSKRDIYEIAGDEVVRLFVDKNKTVWEVDRNLYRPEATFEDLAAHHNKYRDRRGRVTMALRGKSQTRTIGRWRFIDKLIAPEHLVKEYINDVQFRVGRGKGGWAKGLTALGGRPANWVGTWIRQGEATDRLNDLFNPYFIAENKSEWAGRGDDDRTISNAVKARARAMEGSMAREDARAAERSLR